MPVSDMGTADPAPLELKLKPDGVFDPDGRVLNMVVLNPGTNPLLRINKGGQGR